MVRHRPKARRTSTRRRVKRYRTKWSYKVIPERIKRMLHDSPHHMWEEWEDTAPPPVLCEEPTMRELESKGVPEVEWPYYLGYMKRMCQLYKKYQGATLLSEKDSLIAEYVLRGYDKEILQQVQEVAANCAEAIYLSCPMIYACLEGTYTAWAHLWDIDFPQGLGAAEVAITTDETYLYILYDDAAGNNRLWIVDITDGSTVWISPAGADYTIGNPNLTQQRWLIYNSLAGLWVGGASFTILGKYILTLDATATNLLIFSEGALLWTSPAPNVIHPASSTWVVGFVTRSGRYVVAVTDVNRLICFEGS